MFRCKEKQVDQLEVEGTPTEQDFHIEMADKKADVFYPTFGDNSVSNPDMTNLTYKDSQSKISQINDSVI